MSVSSEDRRGMRLDLVAQVCANTTIVVAALVLVGWTLGIRWMTSVVPGLTPMNPATAVCFIIAGATLGLLHAPDANARRKRIAMRLNVLMMVIAAAALCGSLFQLKSSVDQWLFARALAGNRMAWNTAFGFLLIGGALSLIDAKRSSLRWTRDVLTFLVLAIGVLALMGYAFSVDSLYGVGRSIPMAITTAVLFCVLATGMLMARPDHGVMAVVMADNLSGATTRRLLPAAFLVPFALGWMRMSVEGSIWFDAHTLRAIFVLLHMLVLVAIIGWTVRLLHRADQRRHRVEKALRGSEAHMRSIINTAHDAFIAMSAEGQIVDWNPQAETIFGWTSAEALGKQLVDLIIPAEYRDAHDAGLTTFLKTGQGPLLNKPIQVSALRRDGEEFPIELTIAPIRSGNSWLFSAFARDITRRRKAEKEILNAREAAESANRAKSDFLANMSHEIRTPLNGVIGMVELSLDTDLSPEQREYLDMARTSADYLLTVINDILDFSKIEAGRLDLESIDFDLRETIDDTVTTLAERAHRKGLELASHVAPELPELVVGDPVRLRQVLVNLIGNAIKFTEAGEVVVNVELQRRSDEEVILHFSVTDTGIGIPLDRRDSLFKSFSQVDTSTTRKYGGTGLGLSISASLVRMMSGRIWLESTAGLGSTFHFTVSFGVSKLAAVPMTQVLQPLCNLSVLVVDDNSTNLRILTEMLGSWRMHVTGVDSGRAALEALEKAHEAGRPFDLVLLDKMMPEMDGFSLAARIKEHPALVGATLMMLSSGDRRGDIAQCRELGVAAYLMKPVKKSELLNTIATVLHDAEVESPHALPQHRTTFGKTTRRLRLLLAEDNKVNQVLAVRLLEKRGHSVDVCSNGREAVEHTERQTYDVVLLDVQMPEMDGYEATAAIRSAEAETDRHVPIVAMTAHAMKGDREQCIAAGMDGYVAKPLRPLELFEVIERMGDGVASDDRNAPPKNAPALDEETALARVDGDRELLNELVGIFLSQSPQWIADIREAIEACDLTRLHRAAHTFRGAAANLGLTSAIAPSRLLEDAPSLDRAAELKAALTAMDVAVERLRATWNNPSTV